MGRLTVQPAAKADGQMGAFVEAFTRRVEAMPPGQCPVGMVLGQLQASMAQTCGKCTPCAQGMPKIAALLRDGKPRTARDVYEALRPQYPGERQLSPGRRGRPFAGAQGRGHRPHRRGNA